MNREPITVAIGIRHRTWLRTHILPKLYVGARIPSGRFLGRYLGVDESTAGKHMRRVLEEAGVATEVRRSSGRVYVTSLGGQL